MKRQGIISLLLLMAAVLHTTRAQESSLATDELSFDEHAAHESSALAPTTQSMDSTLSLAATTTSSTVATARECAAMAPPSEAILVPLYLVDHRVTGAAAHVDFAWRGFDYLPDADNTVARGAEHPAYCSGDLPKGCDVLCTREECGRAATEGLALNQVAPLLSTDGTPAYANNADRVNSLPLQPSFPQLHPELARAVRTHSVHSAQSFASWFSLQTDAGPTHSPNFLLTSARFERVPAPAERPSSALQHYRYRCAPCFPVDGKLFGADDRTSAHNLGFTGQIHTRVAWRGGLPGEYLTLYATDDAWLYLDGKLVLDLGGVHGLMCRSLELNTGVVRGGIAQMLGGELSCPQTVISDASMPLTFDPAQFTGQRSLGLSIFFTQRSAPPVQTEDGAAEPLLSHWEIQTNVDLECQLTDTSFPAALVPLRAPLPAPRTTAEQPQPSFRVFNMQTQLAALTNGLMREPLELSITSELVHLHRTAHPLETLLFKINTPATGNLSIVCDDPLRLVSVQPVSFRACDEFLTQTAAMILLFVGPATTVTCSLRSSADAQGSPSNFATAPSVSFIVHTHEDNADPVALAEIEGAVGVDTNGMGTVLLNGARSFDPDGLIVSARWTLVSPVDLSPAPTFDAASSLVTFVRGLQAGTTHEFELQVSDDLGLEFARQGSRRLSVEVPANPSPFSTTTSDLPADDASPLDPTAFDSPSAFALTFRGVELTVMNQSALNAFNRGALRSVQASARYLAPSDGIEERVLLALRVPYLLSDLLSRVDFSVLTFVVRAASVTEAPLAQDVALSIVAAALDPSSRLRLEQPLLTSATSVLTPSTLQPDVPDDDSPASDSALSSARADAKRWILIGTLVGLGVLIPLVFCCVLLYRRHARIRSHALAFERERESMAMVSAPAAARRRSDPRLDHDHDDLDRRSETDESLRAARFGYTFKRDAHEPSATPVHAPLSPSARSRADDEQAEKLELGEPSDLAHEQTHAQALRTILVDPELEQDGEHTELAEEKL